MSVTVELPADVEKRLRAESPDLESEAKEAMLVELYRQDGRLFSRRANWSIGKVLCERLKR